MTFYGIFFFTDEDQIDIEQVKSDFQKYGKIGFATQVQQKVYVNFIMKEGAENCIADSPHPKYGRMKRGKFGSDEPQNSKEINSENSYKRNENITHSKNTGRKEKKIHYSRKSESESDEASAKSNGRFSLDADRYGESQKMSNSHSVPRSRISERNSMHYESKHSSDGPPPLLSADNGPPPLLSLDNGPPPLISAVEMNLPLHTRSSFNGPTQRPPLLPTPPMYKHCNLNPEVLLPSPGISSRPVQDAYEDMPPLVSAISQPIQERQRCTQTRLSYQDYVKRYGNYILIIDIPDDITTEEIEKILYPHIPVCVSEPELTDRLRILYCLVTFKSKTEATKAAKQMDGVEFRGQCLYMIRLDELILYSDMPF